MYEIRETLCHCNFNHDYEGIRYMYYNIKYRSQMLKVISLNKEIVKPSILCSTGTCFIHGLPLLITHLVLLVRVAHV